jgi:hypothetical protein
MLLKSIDEGDAVGQWIIILLLLILVIVAILDAVRNPNNGVGQNRRRV